jgi:hypothetical protein
MYASTPNPKLHSGLFKFDPYQGQDSFKLPTLNSSLADNTIATFTSYPALQIPFSTNQYYENWHRSEYLFLSFLPIQTYLPKPF